MHYQLFVYVGVTTSFNSSVFWQSFCYHGYACRNLLGEDLGPLSTKELEQLEHQLESTLKLIRSTRVSLMVKTFINEKPQDTHILYELLIKLIRMSMSNHIHVYIYI